MEQLLEGCALAIERDDTTAAEQILLVLDTIAPQDGDSNQRLVHDFIRALVSRAAVMGSSCCHNLPPIEETAVEKFSIVDFAAFVDLTPWYRFGFTAANAAILATADGRSALHVVDLTTTHCVQIPTLIDAMAARPGSPRVLKLTVATFTEEVGPLIDLTYDELGAKLVNFARSKNVTMEFSHAPSSCSIGLPEIIQRLQSENKPHEEALVLNCHMLLHHIPDETLSSPSAREMSLRGIRGLDPAMVVVVEEDADLTSADVVSRLRSAFDYLWIAYDVAEAFLSPWTDHRRRFERQFARRLENVIAQEGAWRTERLEPMERWRERMWSASFRSVAFEEQAVAEVRSMLRHHDAGWGLKTDADQLVLTWKGHDVVFASAWVPV